MATPAANAYNDGEAVQPRLSKGKIMFFSSRVTALLPVSLVTASILQISHVPYRVGLVAWTTHGLMWGQNVSRYRFQCSKHFSFRSPSTLLLHQTLKPYLI